MTDCSSGPVCVKSGHCEGGAGGSVGREGRTAGASNTHGVDLEQMNAELIIDQEIDTEDLKRVGKRLRSNPHQTVSPPPHRHHALPPCTPLARTHLEP